MVLFEVYQATIQVMGLAGFLLFIQLVIADAAAIRTGHQAGYPIPADRDRFLFRAARAHANTNESIAAFALFALAGMFSAAMPEWLNLFSVIYIISRIGHMLFYYANHKLMRSLSFACSLLALLGMFVVVVQAWFSATAVGH